jgi:hypothetical protein
MFFSFKAMLILYAISLVALFFPQGLQFFSLRKTKIQAIELI